MHCILWQETMELQHKQSRAVAVTCLAFPHGDVNNFIVGSEEGSVFTGKISLTSSDFTIAATGKIAMILPLQPLVRLQFYHWSHW